MYTTIRFAITYVIPKAFLASCSGVRWAATPRNGRLRTHRRRGHRTVLRTYMVTASSDSQPWRRLGPLILDGGMGFIQYRQHYLDSLVVPYDSVHFVQCSQPPTMISSHVPSRLQGCLCSSTLCSLAFQVQVVLSSTPFHLPFMVSSVLRILYSVLDMYVLYSYQLIQYCGRMRPGEHMRYMWYRGIQSVRAIQDHQ